MKDLNEKIFYNIIVWGIKFFTKKRNVFAPDFSWSRTENVDFFVITSHTQKVHGFPISNLKNGIDSKRIFPNKFKHILKGFLCKME